MISPLDVEAMSKDELRRLFKVYNTLNEMMADRGYETFQDPYEKWEDDIKKKKGMHGIFTKIIKNENENENEENMSQNEQNDKKEITKINLYYHYIPNPKLNKDCIEDFIQLMKTADANSGMIITSAKLSQQAKQKIEGSREIIIEVFNLSELVVNITKHELVPKHTLLSQKDKKQLLERYKIRDSQLPKILIGDPVAKYLGLKRGDVVKITRVSETAGRYITYRIAS